MRPQIVTEAIVLSRTDFQEADRILTVLTPKHGKLRVIAKGVRRPKSKLAGGIELFSINNLTILPGRSEIKTLVSSRLVKYYGEIVKDIKRTMLGYELLKRLNRYVEDEAGPEYFGLLSSTLEGLNDSELSLEALELWFTMRLLQVTGHAPNLRTDTTGKTLQASENYVFNFDSTAFQQQHGATYGASHIKLLRLASSADTPMLLKQIKDAESYLSDCLGMARDVLKLNISN